MHTIVSEQLEDGKYFSRYLACVPMKDLRILKSSDLKVREALLTTDPHVQIKELQLNFRYRGDYSLLWNYLARPTSLTHLSLTSLELPDGPPLSHFLLSRITISAYPCRFCSSFCRSASVKKMKIYTKSIPGLAMVEVRHHWQGIVSLRVEYLETDRRYDELNKLEIPIEFHKEFL